MTGFGALTKHITWTFIRRVLEDVYTVILLTAAAKDTAIGRQTLTVQDSHRVASQTNSAMLFMDFPFFFFDWWTILLSFLFCELWLILWIWCMDDVAWSVNTLISWLCTVYQGVPTLSEVISDLEGWRSCVTNYRQSLGWCIDFNPFREEQSSLGPHCVGERYNTQCGHA